MVVYPYCHHNRNKHTRSIMLISKQISTNTWTQIEVNSPDITVIHITMDKIMLRVFNIYNDGNHSNGLTELKRATNQADTKAERLGRTREEIQYGLAISIDTTQCGMKDVITISS